MDYTYKESIANHLGQWIKAKSFGSVVDDPEEYCVCHLLGGRRSVIGMLYVLHT